MSVLKKYLPSIQTIAKVGISLVAIKVVLGFVTPRLPASVQTYVPNLG